MYKKYFFLIFGLFISYALHAQQNKIVSTMEPTLVDHFHTEYFPGQIISNQTMRFYSELNGKLISVPRNGQFVQKDAILFKFDVSHYLLKKKALKTKKSRLNAEFELAKSKYTRYKKLKNGGASKEELETRLYEMRVRALKLKEINVNIEELNYQINKTTVRAPFTGYVYNINVNENELITESQFLFEFKNINDLSLTGTVPLKHLSQINISTKIQLLYKDKTYLTTLKRLLPFNEISSDSFEIFAPLDNHFIVNDAILFRFIIHDDSLIEINKKSVVFAEKGLGIWLVNKQNIVSLIPITLLSSSKDKYIIKLSIPNKKIIFQGKSNLKNGDKVTISTST
ncbi:MAG: hypothetical protein COB35_12755 [Gammaproteobacteria bacterium]|nr:MAG: hypothetical protein COB35_12755 [Gammaproteobacteria bacterium]